MKTNEIKNLSHEVGYVASVIVTLIVLSILVFPLFIAFLPVAILVGCLAIWHADHLNNQT